MHSALLPQNFRPKPMLTHKASEFQQISTNSTKQHRKYVQVLTHYGVLFEEGTEKGNYSTNENDETRDINRDVREYLQWETRFTYPKYLQKIILIIIIIMIITGIYNNKLNRNYI